MGTTDDLIRMRDALNAQIGLKEEAKAYSELNLSIREICDKLWYVASVVEVTGNKLDYLATNYVGVSNSESADSIRKTAFNIRKNIQNAIGFETTEVSTMTEEIDKAIVNLELDQETAAPSAFISESSTILRQGTDHLVLEKEGDEAYSIQSVPQE
jgi:hypothetical protein